MKAIAVFLVTALALAAVPSLGRIIHTDPEGPPALPTYEVPPGVAAAAVLADVRKFFDEGSYAWGAAAANALASRWPDAPERAESDYWRLRCLMQVERFAEVYDGFQDYYRRHGDSLWAAEVVDFELDVYTDCEDVLEDYANREIARGWDNYLEVNYRLDFGHQGDGVDRLYARRRAIIKQGDGLYGRLMDKAADAEERMRWADRRAFNHVKVSAFLDFAVRSYEKDAYAKREAYNKGVAALEMSDDMRSMVRFLDGLQDLFMLPPPAGGPDPARTPNEEYTAWLNGERLRAARAKWEPLAAAAADTPGALMARAALAHYQIVYDNQPAAGVAAFEEFARRSGDEDAAAAVEKIRNALSAPAIAVTAVDVTYKEDAAAAVKASCRGIPALTFTLYEVDPTRYVAFRDAFADAAEATGDLPGVVRMVDTRTVAGAPADDPYKIAEVESSWDNLAAGLYVVEAAGSVKLERRYYLIEKEYGRKGVKEKRTPLRGPIKTGADVEVELTITSPYDFDYVVLEDPKAAGFIYLQTHSGYEGGSGAYVEVKERARDALFERLPAGATTIRYRLRAEIPGTYTALPARVSGVYSPDIGAATAAAVITVAPGVK